jgi:hypothetical protein
MGDQGGEGGGNGSPLTDRALRVLKECRSLSGVSLEGRGTLWLPGSAGGWATSPTTVPLVVDSAVGNSHARSGGSKGWLHAPSPPPHLRVTMGGPSAPGRDRKVALKVTAKSSSGLCSLVDGGAWGAGSESITLAGGWSLPIGRKAPCTSTLCRRCTASPP